jgi:hypothetical protein
MEGGGGLACHGRVTRQSLRQGEPRLNGPDQYAIGHHLEFRGADPGEGAGVPSADETLAISLDIIAGAARS